MTAADTKDQELADTDYANALKAVQSSRDAVAAHMAGKNDALADKGLAESWVRSHQGRVTQKTLDQVNGLGGLQMKWDGTKAQIVGGELSDKQRKLFARDALETFNDAVSRRKAVYQKLGLPSPQNGSTQMPPKSVVDAMKEGQYTHSPDGSITYQKVNGQLKQVGGQ